MMVPESSLGEDVWASMSYQRPKKIGSKLCWNLGAGDSGGSGGGTLSFLKLQNCFLVDSNYSNSYRIIRILLCLTEYSYPRMELSPN